MNRMLSALAAVVLTSSVALAQPASPPAPTPLTFRATIERALAHNVRALTAELQVEGARGARWRALAGLLPSVDAHAIASRQTTNLAAFGFDSTLFPGVPEIVGPFNLFDARVSVSQPILDLNATHDARRASYLLTAARLDQQDVRDFVTLAATGVYLRAVASAKRIDTVRAQVQTAESLLKLATDLHDAGATPGIDTVRARAQLGIQKQRLIAAETDLARQKLQLTRVIGAAPSQPIELADRDVTIASLPGTVDEAVAHARESRADLQAQLARVRAAEEDRRAADAAALPSLHANVDVGAIGSTPQEARRTYAISGTMRVPVFNASRRGRSIEAAAELREREAEAADLAQQVEAEVRTAFLDLQAAQQQLVVSRERVDLANQELSLARSRFSAGVTSNLEVIQAQNELAAATENEIESTHAINVARAALLRTVGGTAAP